MLTNQPAAGLAGCRLLVVGASRGIGRALCRRAADAGARVVGSSRSVPSEPAAGSADTIAHIRCDVRNPDACEELVSRTLDLLGGLDALVYVAGVSPLAPVDSADAAVWREVLDTNVVGAALVLRAALDRLSAAAGHALFISSTMVGRPWPGLTPYAASRAALEELLRGVRREHPALRVTTAVIGPTKTGFESSWDPALASDLRARWHAEGCLSPSVTSLHPDEVAGGLLSVLSSRVRIDHLDLLPDVRAPGWVDR